MNAQNVGKVILKRVDQESETDIIDYLASLFKKTSRDKIEALVRKTPVVLIKGIPEAQAQKAVAKIRQLGGEAEFKPASEPDKAPSKDAPVAQPRKAPPTDGDSRPAKTAVCSQCGQSHAQDDMLFYNDLWVCAACKPTFIQKIKESGNIDGQLNYAGFWIRFGAKFIDGLITGAIGFMIGMTSPILGSLLGSDQGMAVGPIITQLLSILFSALYSTWFVGKFAATPGKMACGLKIVIYDGDRVSYARALGRHFAEWISSAILGIGYLMAAFDDEKRTLHDRICNTRVILK